MLHTSAHCRTTASPVPRASCFYTDDDAGHTKADALIQREDKQPGRGVYYCIGRLNDGATARGKDTVAELDELVVDLDLKDIAQSRDKVIACLTGLILPPHEIRDSGFGLHASWRLKEPVIDEAGLAQAEGIMKQLANCWPETRRRPTAPHCCASRAPTTPRNRAAPVPHRLAGGQRCDISEFEDLFDLYGDRPLLTRKEMPSANGHGTEAGDPGPTQKIFARSTAVRCRRAASRQCRRPARCQRISTQALTGIAAARHSPRRHRIKVVDATMAMAESHKLDWDREKKFTVSPHARQQPSPPATTMYDPTTGAIPCWLAGEFHAAWVAALATGKRPQLTATPRAGTFGLQLWWKKETPQPATQPRRKPMTTKGGPAGAKTVRQLEPSPSRQNARRAPFNKDFDETKLKARAHLYAKHYQRGQATATIGRAAPGNRPVGPRRGYCRCAPAGTLLGEQPTERCRVWLYNGDDDSEEMYRRSPPSAAIRFPIDRVSRMAVRDRQGQLHRKRGRRQWQSDHRPRQHRPDHPNHR